MKWAAESPKEWLPSLFCTLGLPGRAISPDPGTEQAGARLGQKLLPSTATGLRMSTHTNTHTGTRHHTVGHRATPQGFALPLDGSLLLPP